MLQRIFICLFVFLASYSLSCYPTDITSFKGVVQVLENITSLKAQYTQTLVSNNAKQPVVSQGELIFRTNTGFKMRDTTKQQIVLLQKDKIWILNERTQQLRSATISALPVAQILVMRPLKIKEQDYEYSVIIHDNNAEITLTKKNMPQRALTLKLRGNKTSYVLRGWIIQEPGQTITIDLTNPQYNVRNLQDKDFQL